MNAIPEYLYFIGAGGIGMANLERYFMSKGSAVAGYDLTESDLTRALTAEGAKIIYEDNPELIPEPWRDPEHTLVVYTPAVKEDNRILTYFRSGGFEVVKRAALLGKITRHSKAICVAGSHGKTTVSTMVAHILHGSEVGCNAFLGGIARNYGSNLLLSQSSPWSVIEADEYARSFHHLSPEIAIVTSTDPDHLDIYGDEEGYLEGFAHFTSLIRPGGTLILHTGLKLHPRTAEGVNTVTYSGKGDGDWHADRVRFDNGHLYFDIVAPGRVIGDVELGVPVEINIDNAVAAACASSMAGATDDDIRRGLLTFLGAKRRFEIWLRPEDSPADTLLVDDYAHSPAEVKASIRSIRRLYPGRELTVIFQPHLYTRTRDFAPEFAEALSEADRVILPEIYPAREKPIPGVTSEIIYEKLKSPHREMIQRKDLLNRIKNSNFEILMTLGAANLDVLLPDIKAILERQQ